ncbi:VPLPA-CTERM sorting domain-containing protein [Tropicibacter sp. S64]|uniref:VPLPA-CTERM sorting domain-containing protein n=1 Tax=Tropicibacter sp. S64 TaxID=3415122 RepID=UPI003C7A861B
MRRFLVFLTALTLLGTTASAATLNFNNWTVEGAPADGSWEINNLLPLDPTNPSGPKAATRAKQLAQGGPSVLLNNITGIAGDFSFVTSVTTTSDDDFLGFVIGFRPGDLSNPYADYLLVDWKKGSQAGAFAGLTLSHVTGAPGFNDFFTHDPNGATGQVTELARGAVRGSLGWASNASYLFDFSYTPDPLGLNAPTLGLRVCASDALGTTLSQCVQEFNVQLAKGQTGNIGLFTLSQQQVQFTNAIGGALQSYTPIPSTIPLPASVWLLGAGLAGLGVVRRARRPAAALTSPCS